MMLDPQTRTFLNRPLAVRDRTLPSRLVLAPMSKLGTPAFRELLAGYGGCGLMFSEMSAAAAVRDGRSNPMTGFMWRPEELDHLVCQLFGADPDSMAQAARKVAAHGFFGVDVNFGCSAASVCRKGSGAALLKAPERAAAIVAAIRRAVDIPLFVKFRTGWKDDVRIPVDLARRFEDAGADALTLHPRVAPDRRTRPPRWEYIARVKEAVGIPVLGNGDVFDAADCRRMVETTGCDAVALGRLAVARPWIFAAWTRGWQPPVSVHRDCALRMVRLLTKHFDPAVALRRLILFGAYFAPNFRYGHTFFTHLRRAVSLEDADTILRRFFAADPEVARRPLASLMR